MRTCRINRRLFAWMAMGVFLLGALLSAVAPAMRSASGDAWLEVCTLAGSKWVNADAASADAGSHAPGEGGGARHCPWCSPQTPALTLPTDVPDSLALPFTSLRVARFETALPRPVRAWALAPSRAPPLAS